jgi:PAS domain S-box-containing protein
MGCWTIDGSITQANTRLLRLLGCSSDDVEARRIRWPDITPKEYGPLDARALDEILAQGYCAPFEKEYIRSDGSRVPVLIGGEALGAGITDAGVFFAVDLTERKKIDREQVGLAPQVLALTNRQRLVCLLLSYGESEKQIARTLDLGLRTVELEKSRVAKVIGLPISQVTIWAVEIRSELVAAIRGSGGAASTQCIRSDWQIKALTGS